MRRSRIPVRSRIHSFEVSTMRSKSWFVSTRSGTYMPVPVIVAPRSTSGGRVMVRLDLLADVLVHALLHETRQGADRAAEGARSARPVPDEAHAVHAQQGCRAKLLPVDAGLETAERRAHEQRANRGETVAPHLVAHQVGEQCGHALGR